MENNSCIRQQADIQQINRCKDRVSELNGIINSKVSYVNGNAIIEFDKTKTNETKIENAINSTGYKVTDKREN